jgi:hypothetical protein
MQLLPILVAFLLGALTLAFVLFPLVEIQRSASLAVPSPVQTDSEQMARAALQEVELDYQLGNLAERDYRSLRERYARRAALAMQSREAREQELDEVIEEQVRRMREEQDA